MRLTDCTVWLLGKQSARAIVTSLCMSEYAMIPYVALRLSKQRRRHHAVQLAIALSLWYFGLKGLQTYQDSVLPEQARLICRTQRAFETTELCFLHMIFLLKRVDAMFASLRAALQLSGSRLADDLPAYLLSR